VHRLRLGTSSTLSCLCLAARHAATAVSTSPRGISKAVFVVVVVVVIIAVAHTCAVPPCAALLQYTLMTPAPALVRSPPLRPNCRTTEFSWPSRICSVALLAQFYIQPTVLLYLLDVIPTPKTSEEEYHEYNLVLSNFKESRYANKSFNDCIFTKDLKSSESCSKMGAALATNLGVFAVGRNVRYPPKLQAGRIGPFVRLFCLPRPLYPATCFLERNDLQGKTSRLAPCPVCETNSICMSSPGLPMISARSPCTPD
jgi:hypothetical protein